jgi:hypothetical protein
VRAVASYKRQELHSFEQGTHDDNWKQPLYAPTIKRFMERATAADFATAATEHDHRDHQ